MREGSLEAPTRFPLDWQNPWFWDEGALEKEMERIFEICHGCRRCFNLCDSFPRLFDLIDNGPTGELDGVPKEKYAEVEEACTLCDMCFMTKCPYVPPHAWAVDFPHLMLRHRAVLARNGVETEVVHPACCGMPKLELGDLEAVAAAARKVSEALLPWVDKGYDVVALTPSCALMLKFEWPLILPKDPAIERLAQATFDLSEYVVDIAKKEGLTPGLEPIEGGVSLHLACHARAQNMGAKAAEMLRLAPKTRVAVIERCSGHGGIWGTRTE